VKSAVEKLYDECTGYLSAKIAAERALAQFMKENPGADPGGLGAAPAEYGRLMAECHEKAKKMGKNLFE